MWRKAVGRMIDVYRDDAIGVIQCAGTKRSDAGYFVADDGRKVLFVADPATAPESQPLRYARPDDETPAGHTYRERLEQYNRTVRYETTTRTNWHYECVNAFAAKLHGRG